MAEEAGAESTKTTDVSCRGAVFAGDVSDQSAVEFLVAIRAAERRRIAQQLHDGALQLLTGIQLNLGRMRRQGLNDLEATIAECEEMISQAARHLRDVVDADPT